MKEQMSLLLNLINQNKTLNEISTSLGLSNKQLFLKLSMLKNMGYGIDRKYHYNGNITYQFSNPFEPKLPDNKVKIEVPNDIVEFRFIAKSDDHLGSIDDSLPTLDLMTDYAIKNNIHIVMDAGDFFEGINATNPPRTKHETVFEQINYVIKKYPYDKSILNFLCLGNHDATFIMEEGIDIRNILLERRHDIIPVSYGYGSVELGNYEIIMQHPIQRYKFSMPITQKRILLIGHSHALKINYGADAMSIYIPTTSQRNQNLINGQEVSKSNSKTLPMFLDITLKINNNKISLEHIEQLVCINQNKIIKIGEFDYHIQISPINQQKNCESKNSPNRYASQTEKFNERPRNTFPEQKTKELTKKIISK